MVSALALGLEALTRVEEKSGEPALDDDWPRPPPSGEEEEEEPSASLLATRRFRRRDSS